MRLKAGLFHKARVTRIKEEFSAEGESLLNAVCDNDILRVTDDPARTSHVVRDIFPEWHEAPRLAVPVMKPGAFRNPGHDLSPFFPGATFVVRAHDGKGSRILLGAP